MWKWAKLPHSSWFSQPRLSAPPPRQKRRASGNPAQARAYPFGQHPLPWGSLDVGNQGFSGIQAMLAHTGQGVLLMTTSIPRAFRCALMAVFVLVFTAGLGSQSKPAPANAPVPATVGDLNSSLAELSRVAPATDQDLANLHEGGKLHWVAFWHRNQKVQEETSLRRNLRLAVPNLIHDTQTSGGSISTTFKLYNDLSIVCESLDSLLPPGSHRDKPELTAVTRDLSDMNRIREELSSYIQRTAATLEAKHPELVSAGRFPKRIIIDDNVPDKPSPKRRRSSDQ